MNNDEYWNINELESNGKSQEAFELLVTLADKGDPMALMELSARYYSTEGYTNPVHPLEPNHDKSEILAKKAKIRFEKLAAGNDGEAMRMLGYYYLGHWGYSEKDVLLAESWLLKAYNSGCFFAANDLATFYQGSDIEKAKFYYQKAELHNCRVIRNKDLEAP